MLPRILSLAVIPVLGLGIAAASSGSVFSLTSAEASLSVETQPAPERSWMNFGTVREDLREPEAPVLLEAASDTKAADEVDPELVKAISDEKLRRLETIAVFHNPAAQEDVFLSRSMRIGRFSARVMRNGVPVTLVADIAIEFSKPAEAEAAYDSIALMTMRDHVLRAFISAGEDSEIQSAGFQKQDLSQAVVTMVSSAIPGVQDLHLLRFSMREGTDPRRSIRVASAP